jgi:cysteinyl-tRNA synthetase
MPLKIHNSLARRKEEFEPLEDGRVRIYNCGPTVYDYFHIGNARNFITAETVCRYLEYKGYKVTFVQNVTDIEDKIIKRAKELGVEPSEVAEEFTKAYFEDLAELRTRMPDISPKATEHIDDIVQFVQKLVGKGMAYEIDGDVYYEVMKFEDYGKLSGQKVEDTLAGARVEVDERKHHPADFDLWKKSKPGEPGWDSPWGVGRPGWHIECSVMSSKYLGETFDIHIGGNDLVFPHHENEIAQSEALTGKPPARYWMHNGMLQVTGDKMSKSLGNIKSVRELLEEYDPDTIKFYQLSAHYRGPIELKDNSLDEARSALQRIWNCVDLMERLGTTQTEDVRVPPFEKGGLGGISTDRLSDAEKELNDGINNAFRRFEEAMDDDLNTSGAIGAIFELVAAANKFVAEHEEFSAQGKAVLGRVRSALIELCQILGIQMDREAIPAEDKSLVSDLIKLIIEIREDARERKDWAAADKIRDGLADLDIRLEDTPAGTIWKTER